MAFSKLAEVRTGKLALKLLRSVESSGLFLAVDRVVDGRSVRGLFLSESDVRSFVGLFEEHGVVLARWSHSNRVRSARRLGGEDAALQEETKKPSEKYSAITVLPTMPEYRYVFTCGVCGCHVRSRVGVGPGVTLSVCRNCQHVDDPAVRPMSPQRF